MVFNSRDAVTTGLNYRDIQVIRCPLPFMRESATKYARIGLPPATIYAWITSPIHRVAHLLLLTLVMDGFSARPCSVGIASASGKTVSTCWSALMKCALKFLMSA